MKKTLIAVTAVLALTACTKETVYYIESTTTTTEVATEISKTTTTAVRRTPTTAYRGFTSAEENYLWSVESLYVGTIYLTDQQVVDMGWSVCDTLDAGVTLETMIYYLTSEINKTAYPYDSASFISSIVASALGDLCTWHAWQLN